MLSPEQLERRLLMSFTPPAPGPEQSEVEVGTPGAGEGEMPLGISLDVENDDPTLITDGIETTGVLHKSTFSPGFEGASYSHDGDSSKGLVEVTFTPSLQEFAIYEVFIVSTAHPNRATNVPVRITHAGAAVPALVLVDQTINGGVPLSLGEYQAPMSVSLSNAGTNGYTVFDAAHWVLVERQQEVVMDVENDDPTTTEDGILIVGSWPQSTFSSGFGGGSYSHDGNTGKGQKAVTYFADLEAGIYEVAIRATADPNRSTAVPIEVTHAGSQSPSVRFVDQTKNGGQWVPLGEFDTPTQVSILTGGTTGFVVADLVRFRRISTPAGPEIAVSAAGQSVTTGSVVSLGTTTVGNPLQLEVLISNAGSEQLEVESLAGAALPEGVVLLTDLATTELAPGASTFFTVGLTATSVGNFGASVAIVSNDADENPFVIEFHGSVAALGPLTIDAENDDPTTAADGVMLVGKWLPSQAVGGFHGANYLHDGKAGDGQAIATFSAPDHPAAAQEVFVSYTAHSNRASNARYEISHGGAASPTVILVDQRINGNTWYSLGEFASPVSVAISNFGADGYLVIDAVRFSPVRPVIATAAARATNLLRAVIDPTSGLPYNEARRSELETGSSPASDFFVPGQPGSILVSAALSNALRADPNFDFLEGFSDAEYLGFAENLYGSIDRILTSHAFVDPTSGAKALYQAHDTQSGAARSGAFAETVSLLDNVQLIVGLEVSTAYLELIEPRLPADLAARAAALRSSLAGTLSQFDLGIWLDEGDLHLGGPNNPLAGSAVDRITSESRWAPVVAYARQEISEAEFVGLVDALLAQSSSGTTPGGITVQHLPFFGTALEVAAVLPYFKSELSTAFGEETLLKLGAAWAETNAGLSAPLPAYGATGVADGQGGFAVFSMSPAEGPQEPHDAPVFAGPAVGMLTALGTDASLANLGAAVLSLSQENLMHPVYGIPNYQGFGAGELLVNEADPVWGSLEISQMAVALTNRMLGGDFLENLLRRNPSWDAAIDAYLARL